MKTLKKTLVLLGFMLSCKLCAYLIMHDMWLIVGVPFLASMVLLGHLTYTDKWGE